MYCGNCGKELEADAQFCTFCGNKLQSASENRSSSGTAPQVPTTAQVSGSLSPEKKEVKDYFKFPKKCPGYSSDCLGTADTTLDATLSDLKTGRTKTIYKTSDWVSVKFTTPDTVDEVINVDVKIPCCSACQKKGDIPRKIYGAGFLISMLGTAVLLLCFPLILMNYSNDSVIILGFAMLILGGIIILITFLITDGTNVMGIKFNSIKSVEITNPEYGNKFAALNPSVSVTIKK